MISFPTAPKNASSQVDYEFPCSHLFGISKSLYAKIGHFEDKVTIDLFSLHIALTGDLAKRIAQAQKKRK